MLQDVPHQSHFLAANNVRYYKKMMLDESLTLFVMPPENFTEVTSVISKIYNSERML
jgi:hypothetical protein